MSDSEAVALEPLDGRPLRDVVVVEEVGPDGRICVELRGFSGRLVLPLGITLARGGAARRAHGVGAAAAAGAGGSPVPSPRAAAAGAAALALAAATPPVREPEPAARCGATLSATTSKDTAMLYGGLVGGQPVGDVWMLSPTPGRARRWSQLGGCPGKALAWHSCTFLPKTGHAVVLGGLGVEGESEELTVFDCDLNLWYPLATSGPAPSARYGHSCALLDAQQLVVFGGCAGRRYYCDLLVLDTSSWRWSRPEAQGKAPKARAFHAAVALPPRGGELRMVVVGGRQGNNAALDDVHVLTQVGGAWQWSSPVVTGALFSPRCGHQAVALGASELLVFGGWDPNKRAPRAHADAFVLDVGCLHWTAAADSAGSVPGLTQRWAHLAPTMGPRFGHSAALFVGGLRAGAGAAAARLVVFGGCAQVAEADGGKPGADGAASADVCIVPELATFAPDSTSDTGNCEGSTPLTATGSPLYSGSWGSGSGKRRAADGSSSDGGGRGSGGGYTKKRAMMFGGCASDDLLLDSALL
jgi:hypothetical protein